MLDKAGIPWLVGCCLRGNDKLVNELKRNEIVAEEQLMWGSRYLITNCDLIGWDRENLQKPKDEEWQEARYVLQEWVINTV